MAKNKTETHVKKPKDLTRKAYMGIRHMFFYKEIVSGQKIAYRDLSERLEMSPTPVIQALKWLEFQGLIQHIANRGYYATPFSLQEVRENFDVRKLLELSLLPETIKVIDKQGIKLLEKSLDEHRETKGGTFLNERLIKDRDFHLTLASLPNAQVQLQVLRQLFDTLFLKYRGGYFSSPARSQTVGEHQAVFRYVVAGDIKNARKALSDHISRAKTHVLKNLEAVMKNRNIKGI
jgi:DNA-binding GntR family transcriptional regulator